MVLKLFAAWTICFVGLLEMCEKNWRSLASCLLGWKNTSADCYPSHCQLKLGILSTATRASIPGDLVWDVTWNSLGLALTCEQLRLFTLMKTLCGVTQGSSKCWFRLQNEIKTRWGDSKNEIGFDVLSYLRTCCCSLSRFNIQQLVLEWYSRMKTSRQGKRQMGDKVRRKKRGPKRDQNEIRPHPDKTPNQPLPYWTSTRY